MEARNPTAGLTEPVEPAVVTDKHRTRLTERPPAAAMESVRERATAQVPPPSVAGEPGAESLQPARVSATLGDLGLRAPPGTPATLAVDGTLIVLCGQITEDGGNSRTDIEPEASGGAADSTQIPCAEAEHTTRRDDGQARRRSTPPHRQASLAEAAADLPGYAPTEADKLLDLVYGDHAHNNDRNHLSGGIAGDRMWQERWRRMVQIDQRHYSLPKGWIGQQFFTALTAEFRGVRERWWHGERVIVFLVTVLRRTPTVSRTRDIRARLSQRLQLWADGCYSALVDNTESEALGGAPRPVRDDEAAARAYDAQVLSGRMRQAVRGLTARQCGGVYDPDDLDSKTGRPVINVLQGKHPNLRDPPVGEENGAFEPYSIVPMPIPLLMSDEVIQQVATDLTGSAGPSGIDSIMLQDWLFRWGVESQALREEMAEWTHWISNESPPYAAYCAFRAG